MKCEICRKDYKRLGHHVKHTHKVDLQSYYDKYLKTPEDGKCVVCGKPTEFLGENRISAGYSTFCSNACRQVHYKQTLLEHYGVVNVFALKSVKDKIKQTCLQKYGTASASQAESVKQKIRNTNLQKYGVTCARSAECVKQKCKQTRLLNNNGKFNSDAAIQKMKQTNLEKYGTTLAMNNPEIRKKIVQQRIAQYGHAYYTQTQEYHYKVKQTCLAKYGTEHHLANKTVIEKRIATYRNTIFEKYKQSITDKLILFSKHDGVKCICNKCNKEYECSYQVFIKRLNANLPTCNICCSNILSTHSGSSHTEQELYEFIVSLDNSAEQHNRTILHGKELDIYSEKHKLAIEYNGLYWHSELFKSNDYHYRKTIECKRCGIQLIHVFEDDWLYKRDIVKSRITQLFKRTHNKIYARNTVIREISAKDCNEFLDSNHIQGSCQSKYRYGLYYNNELVSVMTFGKSRFKKNEFELLRFCNKLYISIVGGASKLFKHFLKDHPEITSIVSYADRCWSAGNLYEKLGFILIAETAPNYFYIVDNNRENRINYQKHKLVKTGADSNLSEHEIMLQHHMYRIYDSGNLKYQYIQNNE